MMLSLKDEQRRVGIAMGAALLVSITVLATAATVDRAAPAATLAVRLQFALRAELLVVMWLVAAIANVARLRFFSAEDIAGGGGETTSARVRTAAAILQNTTEQVGLAFVTHLIVAATARQSHATILALTLLFFIGRLLFWMGYPHGAKGRAFGFALTFYPNVLAVLACAVLNSFGLVA